MSLLPLASSELTVSERNHKWSGTRLNAFIVEIFKAGFSLSIVGVEEVRAGDVQICVVLSQSENATCFKTLLY